MAARAQVAAPSVLPEPRRRNAPARPRKGAPARRRSHRRPQRDGRIPSLAGRSARVVVGLPSSRAVEVASRGRLWILIIGVLLAGIVTVNVFAVSFGAQAGQNRAATQALERRNAILEAKSIDAISIPTVVEEASSMGMSLPEATSIRYLEHSPADVAAAAARLAAEGG